MVVISFSNFQHSEEECQVAEVKGAASLQEQSNRSASGSTARRPLRIALFGFGTVGSSVARILSESNSDVLKLTHVFNRSVSRKRVEWVPSDVVWTEDAEQVLNSDADVMVELVGGLEIGFGW